MTPAASLPASGDGFDVSEEEDHLLQTKGSDPSPPSVYNRSRVLRCLLFTAFVLCAVAALAAVRQQLLPSHAAASDSSGSVRPSTLYSLTANSSGEGSSCSGTPLYRSRLSASGRAAALLSLSQLPELDFTASQWWLSCPPPAVGCEGCLASALQAIVAARESARVGGLRAAQFAPYNFSAPQLTFDQHAVLERRKGVNYRRQLCLQTAQQQAAQTASQEPGEPGSEGFLPYDIALRSAVLLADIVAAEHALLPSLRSAAARNGNVHPETGFDFAWLELDVRHEQPDASLVFQGSREEDERLAAACAVNERRVGADGKDACAARLPLSSVECVNSGQAGRATADSQTCTVRGLLYSSAQDRWYYHGAQAPSPSVVAPEESAALNFVGDALFDSALPHRITRVHRQPALLIVPPHSAVFHGALEQPLARFALTSQYQNLSYAVDDTELQTFTTSLLMNAFAHNWGYYNAANLSLAELDSPQATVSYGRSLLQPPREVTSFTYNVPLTRAVQQLQSRPAEVLARSWHGEWLWFERAVVFSPLRRHTTFHSEGYNWEGSRRVNDVPFPSSFYSARYSAYHDFVLRRLGLPSRLAQNLQRSAAFPSDNALLRFSYPMRDPLAEYEEADCPSCEYVVFINRGGKRRTTNADALLAALLPLLPHRDPADGSLHGSAGATLRLWPRVTDWGPDLRRNAAFARRIRVLIAAHGAGMSFAFFMRPGAAVLENDNARCQWQRDMFGIPLQLQHLTFDQYTPIFDQQSAASWKSNLQCDLDGSHEVVVPDVVQKVLELIEREERERPGKYRAAVLAMERGA